MKPAGIGSLNTPPWTFLLVQPRGWRVRGIRTAERSWDLAQLHREPSFINLWPRIRLLCSLYAHPIMASGKTQSTGCALVSNLKVPEALLRFHQANMGWPASSWISAPGVAKRRGSGGNLGNSPWTARRIWSSRLAWRGPCFHGRVTAAHPVVGFHSALLTLFLAQARPGFAFPCVVRVASHAKVQSRMPEALQTCSGAGRARTNLDLGRPLAVLGAGPGPPR